MVPEVESGLTDVRFSNLIIIIIIITITIIMVCYLFSHVAQLLLLIAWLLTQHVNKEKMN
jgi:hypothetical protein